MIYSKTTGYAIHKHTCVSAFFNFFSTVLNVLLLSSDLGEPHKSCDHKHRYMTQTISKSHDSDYARLKVDVQSYHHPLLVADKKQWFVAL